MSKLTPNWIMKLDEVAMRQHEDTFFAVRSADREWFVTNWILGLRFLKHEVRRSPQLELLEERTDAWCSRAEKFKDIIQHIYRRSWMDILVGPGIYKDVRLTELREDEAKIFSEHDMLVMPFETDDGQRYFVRTLYFDLADEMTGSSVTPVIFRPMGRGTYPYEYRPMVLLDENGPRGILQTVSEENLWNPIDKTEEYRQIIKQSSPDLFLQETL